MRSKRNTSALGLSNVQLAAVMNAASTVPVEKRGLFLNRVAAWLNLRGAHLTDADLGRAVRLALIGLQVKNPVRR